MARKEGEESIRDALQRTDKTLYNQVIRIWDVAEKWILEAQTSPDGHSTGPNHVRTVEQNLSRLIPDEWKGNKDKINALELFILSATSCLHDTGKIDPFTNDHGITAASDIRNNPKAYELDENQADLISQIIRIHTNRDQISELDPIRHSGPYEIRLRNLAALFCLADTLHCDRERIMKNAKENLPKTRFRRQINAWFFDDREVDCVRLEAVPKNRTTDIECLREGLEYINNREMGSISTQLKLAGYPSEVKLKIISDWLENQSANTHEREPGLSFYTERDESEFRGRREETDKLWGNVLSAPVSLLSGKSGVGKTSLIMAGLFPRLTMTETPAVRCRLSSKEPVSQIVTDLWRELLSIDEPPPKGFAEAIRQVSERHPDTKVIIVLDQFEEVVRVPVETLGDLQLGILQTMARAFSNLRLLVSYQTEAHDEVMRFLKSIHEPVWQLPTSSLLPLSREGARETLDTLFASKKIGVDPSDPVIDIMLDDIYAQGQDFYPPFLQIVASTLIESAKLGDKLVTLALYKELGGAEKIIGTFLLNQLNAFVGQKRVLAENILKILVGAGGLVRQKSFAELQHETKIDESVLHEILKELGDKRLILPVIGDKYEIIHSYLARLVDQQLGEEERELKRLREHLLLKSREFESTKDLLSMTDLARLYCVRDQITPDKQEAKLLMHCCLAGYGPSWYWIRNYTAEECTPFVVEALSHPNEQVRKNATEMIAVLKGKDALPYLKKMLEDDRSPVQEAAVWAIANLGMTEALPDIKKMLSEDNWAVREAAIRALGKLQAQDASTEIEELLQRDYYWQVRRAAVEVLVKLKGSEKLKEWIHDPDWRIKAPAIRCLSELEGEKSLSWLRPMLRDERDWAVRTEVVLALTKLKDEESLEQLRQMADFEKDWRVKEAAIEASIVLEGENALPTARMLLGDRDQYKRKTAARLVALLGGNNDAPLIARLLQDRWGMVRIAAVNALTRIDGEKSLKRFFQMLKSDNEDVRKALARGIGNLGSDKEAMKLAKMIASLKFGEWGGAANEALVRLDRKLYSPYQSKLRMLIEGTGTNP
jgi:HEAT repeat protein